MIKKANDQVSETRENMRGGEGQIKITHYFKKDEIAGPCRLCARLELAPGCSVGSHEHMHEDEVFIIQQGTGLVNDNGIEMNVAPGDAILTGKGASHAISNIGDEPLIITALIVQYPE